jgi:uncharacterized protein (TIGR03000 family)
VEPETPPEPPAPPAEVGAKKLHAVFLLDTKDPSIGADAASEGKSVEELLAKLPSSERHAFRVIQGSDLTARKVLTVLENLPVGPQETLFVYCNLHGARDKDGGQLLQLQGGSQITRKQLLAAMARKKARLSVLVTDSCFNRIDAGPESSGGPKARRKVLRSTPNANLLRVLLFNHQGVVNVNSCAPDQFAFGGVFTPTLVELCSDDRPQLRTWEGFFTQLQQDVGKIYAELKARFGESNPDLRKQARQTPRIFGTLARPVADGAVALANEPTRSRSGGAKARGPAGVATLTVRVPDGARLFVNDHLSWNTGRVRVFETPEIQADKTYRCTLRLEMKYGGKVVTRTYPVEVKAGQQRTVEFRPG